MKPTRNRFFCKDCGRMKMLFETKKKADTFMEFNSKEISEETGYKPERSYYCAYCGGWHVTSSREQLDIKSRTEKVLDSYGQEKKQKTLHARNLQKTESKVQKRIQTQQTHEEIQKGVLQAYKKELERELEAYAIPLREQAALKKAQATERKKQQKEKAALEKAQAKAQRKIQREQAASERAEAKAERKKQRKLLKKAQATEQRKIQREQAALEKAKAIEQKKKQKELEAPILAKKVNDLKSILHYTESYIGMVERLTMKNFTPDNVSLLETVAEELEKAKSIGISYKKSEKRIAGIKQRAGILRNKYMKKST